MQVYMLYAVGTANHSKLKQGPLVEGLQESYRRRDELNDYSRALLALALHAAGSKLKAAAVAGNIVERARTNTKTMTACWGTQRHLYWHQSSVEATSFSLRALLAVDPANSLIPAAVTWLIRQRRGARWGNTKDTALACFALTDYLTQSHELNPEMTILVEVDGRTIKSIHVNAKNLCAGNNEITLKGAAVGTGNKTVTLRCRGKGRIYWNAVARFFTREPQLPASGQDIEVRREYVRVIPRVIENEIGPGRRRRGTNPRRTLVYLREPLAGQATLNSGEVVEVELHIMAKRDLRYVMIEDPKPAGCEPVAFQTDFRLDGLPVHAEFRDEKVSLFIDSLPRGLHVIRYSLRAELPGSYHALPTRVESMYSPLLRSNSVNSRLNIVPAQPRIARP